MTTDLHVAPTDLRDYLKALGWSALGRALQDRLYVMEHPHFPGRQLIFPMDSAAADYGESVDLTLQKLADLAHLPVATGIQAPGPSRRRSSDAGVL